MSLRRQKFAACLAKYLEQRGARARLARRLGTNPSTISNVLAARWAPAKPEDWADALDLSGSDRSEFVLLGTLAASPDAMTQHAEKMQSLVTQTADALNAQFDKIRREWLTNLSDQEAKRYPPVVGTWKKILLTGSQNEVEGVMRAFARIPIPMKLDGSLDIEAAFFDPICPVAGWWRERAIQAEHANEMLRGQLTAARAALSPQPPAASEPIPADARFRPTLPPVPVA